MNEKFTAVRVTDRVWWVGAIDWGIREFHGYRTARGTTYNAYLITGEANILIDTVKKPFMREMTARIASVIDPAKIDYIISNHAEMDHSGCLTEMIDAARPEKVFASRKGVEALDQHFRMGSKLTAVNDGETLSLGGAELTFMETRMLHWPDSMFTYLAGDGGVLFSQDAFGMHLAGMERFADQSPDDILRREAARYFANILMPYAPLVKKLLEKVSAMNLEMSVIAPDHGPIWRRELEAITGLYARWSAPAPSRKALVVYDTMWNSTARMADAVCEGLAAGGAAAKMLPISAGHRSDIAAELLDAGALLVGSPTLNGGLFPTVADILTYLRGLKPKGLVGAAFGSYGWAGEAVKEIEKYFADMKIEIVREGVKCRYVPDAAALDECHALGRSVAEKLNEKAAGK